MAGPLPDATSWPLRDYVSPGLRTLQLDDAFPHLRAGDALHHPWKYLRRDVPHVWYADERFPLMGFLNRDEATLLHNIALQFAGKRALEIGSWLGWSTCHLALGGVELDVIDPAHDDPVVRASVEESLARCGAAGRVRLAGGRSPDSVAELGGPWSLFFIDGDHEAEAPVRDTLACLPYAAADCAFVFHDLAAPAVAAAVRLLAQKGFHVVVYQTAQIMAMAWRGDVTPVAHVPDPEVAWQMPPHLAGLPVSGIDFTPPARTEYRRLRDVAYESANERPSVCIVTSEMVGPFKNGGIGTATTGLAELLASDGLRVTVLYTGAIWAPDVDVRLWRERYAARGIELVALSFDDLGPLAGPLADRGFGSPWLVYRWLAERRFDVVHFNDCAGEGSLCLAAKKLGLGFADSLLVVALHSPSSWVLELNQALPTSLLLSAYHAAEQFSVAWADVLWSPSRYLLDWSASRGFALPAQTFVQQYALPGLGAPAARGRTAPPREIVFFGRLEERKGLRLFCNAIHLLREELGRRGITVTFLGKPERCAGMPSLEYIARRAAAWPFRVRTLTDLGQPEALEVIRRDGVLAVMASPADNSPCTVYEALANGIPFLAARTGGIPELVEEADREHVLFEHSTEALRNALWSAIERGGWIARPAVPFEETRRSWLAMHAHWRSFLPRTVAEEATATPRVAAIIDHPPGAPIQPTIDSLVACPAVHRFLVLNRGGDPLQVPQIDLLADDPDALDRELAAIAEETVLLIHSGVAFEREAFEAMLRALAASEADGLQPAGRIDAAGRSRFVPPLGASPAFSLYEGVTFTGALLMKRDALRAAKQGRPFAVESAFLGLADFCAAGSARIWPYPAVVAHRTDSCRVDVKSRVPARIAAYGGASPSDRYYMLAAGYGAANGEPRAGTKMRMALVALRLGLTPVVRIAGAVLRRLRRHPLRAPAPKARVAP